MESRFLLLQFLDQFPDSLFRERIMNLSGQHAIPTYSLLEFLAFITHGSPRSIGRERAALSVTDDCRERGDDEPILSHDHALRHCSFLAVQPGTMVRE
jgi:hypothetical protein